MATDFFADFADSICSRLESVVECKLSEYLDKRIPQEDSSFTALTVEELADRLKISMPSAYELVNSDGFPAFRVGRSIRIDEAGLRAWVLQHPAGEKGSGQA